MSLTDKRPPESQCKYTNKSIRRWALITEVTRSSWPALPTPPLEGPQKPVYPLGCPIQPGNTETQPMMPHATLLHQDKYWICALPCLHQTCGMCGGRLAFDLQKGLEPARNHLIAIGAEGIWPGIGGGGGAGDSVVVIPVAWHCRVRGVGGQRGHAVVVALLWPHWHNVPHVSIPGWHHLMESACTNAAFHSLDFFTCISATRTRQRGDSSRPLVLGTKAPDRADISWVQHSPVCEDAAEPYTA